MKYFYSSNTDQGTWLAKRTLHKPQSYCSSFSISLQSVCIKFLCAWLLTASQDKQFTTFSQQPMHSYIYSAFRLIRSVIIFLFLISHITFIWYLKVGSSSWVIVNQSKVLSLIQLILPPSTVLLLFSFKYCIVCKFIFKPSDLNIKL